MPVLNDIDYDGTEEDMEWNRPRLNDFIGDSNWESLDRDEQMDVVRHFLITEDTGENPPDNFQQLSLPVVNPDTGKLNQRALDNANARLPQTEGIPEEFRDTVQEQIDKLQSEEFGE